MLAKLKVECGFQLTVKLEGMLHDMKVPRSPKQNNRTFPPFKLVVPRTG